jgi:predicted peroxiredoxin
LTENKKTVTSEAAKEFLKAGIKFTVCKKCGHIIGYMADEKILNCLNPKCGAPLSFANESTKDKEQKP